MTGRYVVRFSALLGALALTLAAAASQTTAPQKPYKPESGQPGKDVVWVPTSQALVEKMLEMVHGAPVDRAGESRRHLAPRRRSAHAQAAVPETLRHPGGSDDYRGATAGRRNRVQCQRGEVHRSRQWEHHHRYDQQ